MSLWPVRPFNTEEGCANACGGGEAKRGNAWDYDSHVSQEVQELDSHLEWGAQVWKGAAMRGRDHHIGWDQRFYFMLSLDLGCRSISMRLGGLFSLS